MDIIIKETGETKTLEPSNSVPASAIADIIGNAGGFGSDTDESVVSIGDEGVFVTCQENFDWWQDYINEYGA